MKRNAWLLWFLALLMLVTLTVSSLAETLMIPSTTTVIAGEAFYGDEGIKEIILPEYIRSIGNKAFAKTSVEEIYLPSSLQYIADDAFEDTPLRKAYAQEGTYSYQWALENGYLKTITLTADVDTVPAAGGVLTLTIEYEGAWGAEVVDEWLSIDGEQFQTGENDGSIQIQVTMNTLEEARTSTVFVFGEDVTAEYTLTQDAYVPVTTLTLDETILKLPAGTRKGLLPTFSPTSATNRQITWTSDNTAVATVSESGAVDALDVGLATITATAENGTVSAVCQVCVLPQTGTLQEVPLFVMLTGSTSIRYSWNEVPYATGYNLVRRGSDGSTRSITYLVREESYTDTGLTPGVTYTYTINAYHYYTSAYSLESATSSISLMVPLTLEGKNYNIINVYDNTAYLNAYPPTQKSPWTALVATTQNDNSAEQMWALEAVPNTTDHYRLRVMEFNGLYVNATTSGASIGSGGTIFKVIPKGSNYIFATTDGNYALSYTTSGVHTSYPYQKYSKLVSYNANDTKQQWTLSVKSASLTVNATSVSLEVGKTATITAYITSDGEDNVPPLLFTSNNTSVATVSSTGVIAAKKAGTTTITVRTVSGISQNVTVTVTAAAAVAPTVGPTCTASVSGRNVIISWNAIEGASWYDVEIYDEAAWNLHQTSPAPKQWTYKYTSLSDTSYSVSLADGNYHTAVAAVNTAGYKYGVVIGFAVDTTPVMTGSPDATVSLSGTSALVTWTAVPEATQYVLSVYYKTDWDANKKDQPVFSQTVSSIELCAYNVPNLEVCDYAVSVTATNPDCSRTGAPAYFTIGDPIRSAPTITINVDGNSLGVGWTAVANADSYLVEAFNMNDWNNGKPNQATHYYTESATISLRAHIFTVEDDYYWVRVTAINGASRMSSTTSRIAVGANGPVVQFEYTTRSINENVCFGQKVFAEGNTGTLKVNLYVSNKYYEIVNTKFTSPNQTLNELASSGIIYNSKLVCGNVFNVESSKPNSNDRSFYIHDGYTWLLFGGYYGYDNESRTVVVKIMPSTDGSYRVGKNDTLTIKLQNVDAQRPTDKSKYTQDEWALQSLKWLEKKFPSGYRWNHYLGTTNNQSHISEPNFGCSTDFHVISSSGTNSRFNSMLTTGHKYSMGERVCNGNTKENSATCKGFARFIGYEIFGSTPGGNWTSTTYNSYSDFTNISGKFHPGDYVETSGHACIIASTDGTKMLHCNHSWGGTSYRCRISRTNDGIWTWTTKQWLEYEYNNGHTSYTVYHYNKWDGKK